MTWQIEKPMKMFIYLYLIQHTMKKLFVLSICLLFIQTSYSQKVNEAEVPQAVSDKFRSLFKNSKPEKWTKEKGNYEAQFMVGGSETSVVIDPAGNHLETETGIPVGALPKAILEACEKKFPGKKIKEASKIVDDKGAVKYEAQIDGKDHYFDESGVQVK